MYPANKFGAQLACWGVCKERRVGQRLGPLSSLDSSSLKAAYFVGGSW